MPDSRFPKPYADFVARLRVPGGFLLVAAFAWLAEPSWRSLAWGMPVSLVGLWLRGWAAGHLEKNERLATGGPYAYVRNPLYLGSLIVAAGMVIAAGQWFLAVLFAAVFGLVYLPVIELEEQHLRKLFAEYDGYARRVPMLAPRWRGGKTTGKFRARVYLRNQEYQALAAFLAGVAFLVWRASRGQ